jgi:tyrosyl-tRNA synthetase
VTTLVHGPDATAAVLAASQALFGQGDLSVLDPDTLESALRELPNTTTSPNASIAQLLADTGLVASQSEGRRAIAQGGVSLDNVRVDDETATLEGRVPPGGMAVLRRGKKTLAGVFVE